MEVGVAVHPDESFAGLRGGRETRTFLREILVSWPRIVLAVEISAEHGHGGHRQPELTGAGRLRSLAKSPSDMISMSENRVSAVSSGVSRPISRPIIANAVSRHAMTERMVTDRSRRSPER